MKKSYCTKEQQKEISDLTKDHCDALVAFGADMHCAGRRLGALQAGAIFIVGLLITSVVKKRKSQKIKNK